MIWNKATIILEEKEVKIALNNFIKEDLDVILKYFSLKKLRKLVKDFA